MRWWWKDMALYILNLRERERESDAGNVMMTITTTKLS